MASLRVVTGTAVYTSAFTPSTTPLPMIANTKLLTLKDNRFKDNSTNAYAITVTGAPKIQAFSPFEPSTSYSTATNGGSSYFDGTGDYLTVPASTNLVVGVSDFTIDGWIYPTSRSSISTIYYNSSGGGDAGYALYVGPSGALNLSGISNNALYSSAGVIPLNAWSHFAVTDVGNILYVCKWSPGCNYTTKHLELY